MDRVRRPWLRGAMTLGVLAVFGAAALISNAGAVAEKKEASKKFVKKRLKRVRNNLQAADTENAGRVAYAVDSTDGRQLDPAGNTDAIAQLSTTVVAPAPGFLVLNLWMDSYDLIDSDDFLCYVTVDGAKVQSSQVWVGIDGASNVNEEENCISHAVVPVAPGSHTVELVTAEVDNTSILTDEIGVSAQYVPYDGAGARPTNFDVVRGADGRDVRRSSAD